METPIGVLLVYAALAVWALLFLRALKTRSFGLVIGIGLVLAVYLNARYLIEGAPAGIAFFIGIYDVVNNLFIGTEMPGGMAPCVGAAHDCTVWGDRYAWHSSWGVAFHDRFAAGPEFRSWLLYAHLTFNTLAFLLLHAQMARPGGSFAGISHRLLGRITFAFMTIGVFCAVWLASQHGSVTEYGGGWAQWGFYSMAAFVFGTALMGVLAIRKGDRSQHRVWMWRFAGSMWGSFWLFRAMLLVLDPTLRGYESAAILTCIWGSAPLGIVIAEMIRRRIDSRSLSRTPAVSPAE